MHAYRGLLVIVCFVLWAPALSLAAVQPATDDVSLSRLGPISFPVSCSPATQRVFPHAVALLQSEAFEQALREFAVIETEDPKCAMAYWGEAMARWRPLSPSPDRDAMTKGLAAIAKADSLDLPTGHEQGYIHALHAYYADYDRVDEHTRIMAYRSAMARLHRYFPKDNEVAVFYAVALLASAASDNDSPDRRKAADILEKVFVLEPDHPGAAHYLIYCFDRGGMAKDGLLAAQSYARIAPPVSHDLHLPSHIFTRLGLWQESIDSNLAAERAAKDSAGAQHLSLASSEQLHAMDYLVYAYLQAGRAADAERVAQELNGIHQVEPTEASFYAIAAIPARLAVEQGRWSAAASLEPYSAGTPETQAITYWARALGAAHIGNVKQARADIQKLESLRDSLAQQHHGYDWAAQVEVQRREAAGWLAHAFADNDGAVSMMQSAIELEESTQKNAITPGPVLPAQDLMGDLLMELHRPREAFQQYKASLAKAPHRDHAIRGAERAAETAADQAAALRNERAMMP